jgi:hypothetical protein
MFIASAKPSASSKAVTPYKTNTAPAKPERATGARDAPVPIELSQDPPEVPRPIEEQAAYYAELAGRLLEQMKSECLKCNRSGCLGYNSKCHYGCYRCGDKDHKTSACRVCTFSLADHYGFCRYCYVPGGQHSQPGKCPQKSRVKLLIIHSFKCLWKGTTGGHQRDEAFKNFLREHLKNEQTFHKFLCASQRTIKQELK